MMNDVNEPYVPGATIKVFGVGGGGTNAVSSMIRSNIEGVDFIAANTDVQSLKFSLSPQKIQIGKELTKGLGAGADPDVGRDAALEDRHELHEAVAGADMVFITAGMGGGTGTGGASVVAQIAKETNALTVGVVTKPFLFEGNRRKKHAEAGIEKLREYVDTLIVIPNQRLLNLATPDLSMMDAFQLADNVLVNAVKGISDIINVPGSVNVDFADVKTIMSSTGRALMGIGTAKGENRATIAASQAISSPLLEDVDIEGATGILINITAGESVSLLEVNEACSIIQEAAHTDANIIFGAVIDENLGDEIQVTVIATGFPPDGESDRPTTEVTRNYVQPQSPLMAKPQKQEEPSPAEPYRNIATQELPQAPSSTAAPIEPEAVPSDQGVCPEDLTKLTFEQEGETQNEVQAVATSHWEQKPAPAATTEDLPTQKHDTSFSSYVLDQQRSFSASVDEKLAAALDTLSSPPSPEAPTLASDSVEIPAYLRTSLKDTPTDPS